MSSCGCTSKQKASCGARMGLCCPLPALRCYHTPAEAGGCMCPLLPSGVTTCLLRQVDACALSRCLSFAQAQQTPGSSCGRGMPPRPSRISSRAGWQAKEESSPAMVLAACCSGAVTGCVMLLSGGKGGYVRSRVSVLASAPLCTSSQLPGGRAEREEQQGCTQLLSLPAAAFGICWCTSVVGALIH